MDLENIKKLALMARIDMDETEMKGIAKDFDVILAYVSHVQEVTKLNNAESLHENPDNYFLQNAMREDIVTNIRGGYTDRILADAPDTQDGFLKVKQIL